MAKPDHTFTSFDAWVIDIVAALGLGWLVALIFLLIYSGLAHAEEGQDGGGAVIGVGLLAFLVSVVYLRKARARRDSKPSAK
jgi:hypothetical protein